MIEYDLDAQSVQQSVVSLGRPTFEERINISRGTHAVNNIFTGGMLFEHLSHHFEIVLQVCINADEYIPSGAHQACKKRNLVPTIPRKLDAPADGIWRFAGLADQLPSAISAPVVHQPDATGSCYPPLFDKFVEQDAKPAQRLRQDVFLVVAGNDDSQNRL